MPLHTHTQKHKLSLHVVSREVQEVSVTAARCLCLTVINIDSYEATYLIGLHKQYLHGRLCAVPFKRSLQSQACICSIVSVGV